MLNHSEFAALTYSRSINEKVTFAGDLVSADDASPQTRAGDHTWGHYQRWWHHHHIRYLMVGGGERAGRGPWVSGKWLWCSDYDDSPGSHDNYDMSTGPALISHHQTFLWLNSDLINVWFSLHPRRGKKCVIMYYKLHSLRRLHQRVVEIVGVAKLSKVPVSPWKGNCYAKIFFSVTKPGSEVCRDHIAIGQRVGGDDVEVHSSSKIGSC